MSSREVEVVARALIDAKGKAVAFTGAGISTESGIPDFRSPQGVWTKDPGAQERLSLNYFLSDPDESWQDYIERFYSLMIKARPNIAHYALAKLEAMGLIEAVVTQNIDRLHHKAGSKNVIELHGRYDEVQCLRCNFREDIEKYVSEFRKTSNAPRCPKCGFALKPAIVYFGEPLPEKELSNAFALARSCKVMLVIGSSLVVYPAALLPETALQRGARLFIVNLSPTRLDREAELVIREKASEFLPKVAEYLASSQI